jgi:hypothetical protein
LPAPQRELRKLAVLWSLSQIGNDPVPTDGRLSLVCATNSTSKAVGVREMTQIPQTGRTNRASWAGKREVESVDLAEARALPMNVPNFTPARI